MANVAELSVFSLANLPLSISRGDLIVEQQADVSLKCLFEQVLPVEVEKDSLWGYFVHESLLVKKWMPHGMNFVGDPVYQVVIPNKRRAAVLRLENNESGHCGVGKTYDQVLRHFFWPKLVVSHSSSGSAFCACYN